MHRSSENIGTIAAALAKAQLELTKRHQPLASLALDPSALEAQERPAISSQTAREQTDGTASAAQAPVPPGEEPPAARLAKTRRRRDKACSRKVDSSRQSVHRSSSHQ